MNRLLQSKRALILAAIFMAAVLAFNGSFYGLVHNLLAIKRLNKENAELDAQYQKLSAEYEKMRDGDTSYIEEAARVRYNMSQKGEFEFRLSAGADRGPKSPAF
ncbi:MAG: septum formation initiator family protein [Elusimicrobiota bacterium]|jgi:cell division protein FtsB|nr:septum formation initiator family protein [Elusimicrobiota bacterium]